jgi:hypothetical protein
MVSYRKTKQGEWVAFGPVNEIAAGVVTITTRAGKQKTERVVRLGRPFEVDGVEHVYGYLAPKAKSGGGHHGHRHGRSCSCSDDCCSHGCRCDSSCNCRGGPIFDC